MSELINYSERFLKVDKALSDVVCILLFRKADKKIGLKKFDNDAWWLPFNKSCNKTSWTSLAKDLMTSVAENYKICGILHVWSVQYHPQLPLVNRIVFRIDVENVNENSTDISWFSSSELVKITKTNLKGLEPLNFLSKIMQSSPLADFEECKISDAIISSREEIQDNESKSNIDLLLDSAGFTNEDQELIYFDFMCSVYPCKTMDLYSFKKYMQSLSWNNELITSNSNYFKQLFRAFDANQTGHLTHRDLAIGLAAMNLRTQHGGPPAEIRCRYIFRFYDSNSDGALENCEFKSMIYDINKIKGVELSEEALNEAVEVHSKTFELQCNAKLNLQNFLQTVGHLKFRGTSSLFRSSELVISSICKKWNFIASDSTVVPCPKRLCKISPEAQQHLNGTIVDKQYDLATHSVKVKRSGTLLDVNSLWDLEGTVAFSKSIKFPAKMRIERISSVDSFNLLSKANEMLKGLSYFEHCIKKDLANRTPKEAFSWGSTDMNAFACCLLNICQTVYDILKREPRIIQVTVPAYVLGDIHGNFSDLVCFEKALWRMGPLLTPANVLFLGDYVDRGQHGIEVVAYLFSQKILAPEKFFLLRGNHEVRSIQKMFTFYQECLNKFGGDCGNEVWEAINDCFDVMPLAAVIDNKVFCSHGGIPPPWFFAEKSLYDVINSIPNPLPEPDKQSPLAWELMWNDPLNQDFVNVETSEHLKSNCGFLPNTRRGTAHVFSLEALEYFLTTHKLSYVIRAHEVQQAGFKLHLNGKLLTVFSSSKYCGGSNEAACILADRLKLRTIRLDTS